MSQYPIITALNNFNPRRELDEQKARLEDQRARLEAELREQFRRDIAALRDEMAEVNRDGLISRVLEFIWLKMEFELDFIKFDQIYDWIMDKFAQIGFKSEPKSPELGLMNPLQEDVAAAADSSSSSADSREAPRLRRDGPPDGGDEGRPQGGLWGADQGIWNNFVNR